MEGGRTMKKLQRTEEEEGFKMNRARTRHDGHEGFEHTGMQRQEFYEKSSNNFNVTSNNARQYQPETNDDLSLSDISSGPFISPCPSPTSSFCSVPTTSAPPPPPRTATFSSKQRRYQSKNQRKAKASVKLFSPKPGAEFGLTSENFPPLPPPLSVMNIKSQKSPNLTPREIFRNGGNEGDASSTDVENEGRGPVIVPNQQYLRNDNNIDLERSGHQSVNNEGCNVTLDSDCIQSQHHGLEKLGILSESQVPYSTTGLYPKFYCTANSSTEENLRKGIQRLAVGSGRPLSRLSTTFPQTYPESFTTPIMRDESQQQPFHNGIFYHQLKNFSPSPITVDVHSQGNFQTLVAASDNTSDKKLINVETQTESWLVRLVDEERQLENRQLQLWCVPVYNSSTTTQENPQELEQFESTMKPSLPLLAPIVDFPNSSYLPAQSPLEQTSARFHSPQELDNQLNSTTYADVGLPPPTTAGTLENPFGNELVATGINAENHCYLSGNIAVENGNQQDAHRFNFYHSALLNTTQNYESFPATSSPICFEDDEMSNLGAAATLPLTGQHQDDQMRSDDRLYDNSNADADLEINTILSAFQLLQSGFNCNLESTDNYSFSPPVYQSFQRGPGLSQSGYHTIRYKQSNRHQRQQHSFRTGWRNYTPHSDHPLVWKGYLLPKDSARPRYSEKIFVGGINPKITKIDLLNGFQRFGASDVSWCALGGEKIIQGCAYVTLGNKHQVDNLLRYCRPWVSEVKYWRGQRTWHYDMPFNRRFIRVEVILWDVCQGSYIIQYGPNDEEGKRKTHSIFLGNLHARFSAQDLANLFMQNDFRDVRSVKLGMDKTDYPVGYAKVSFLSKQSFVRAVKAKCFHIETPEFTRVLQIEPFVEGSPCDVCCNKASNYFCKNERCYLYYCEKCYWNKHWDDATVPGASEENAGKRHSHNKGIEIVIREKRTKGHQVVEN